MTGSLTGETYIYLEIAAYDEQIYAVPPIDLTRLLNRAVNGIESAVALHEDQQEHSLGHCLFDIRSLPQPPR